MNRLILGLVLGLTVSTAEASGSTAMHALTSLRASTADQVFDNSRGFDSTAAVRGGYGGKVTPAFGGAEAALADIKVPKPGGTAESVAARFGTAEDGTAGLMVALGLVVAAAVAASFGPAAGAGAIIGLLIFAIGFAPKKKD